MVSIHPYFTINNGKMDQFIELFDQILVITKSNELKVLSLTKSYLATITIS